MRTRTREKVDTTVTFLSNLSPGQVRALASQHKVPGALSDDVSALVLKLSLLSVVRQIAREYVS